MHSTTAACSIADGCHSKTMTRESNVWARSLAVSAAFAVLLQSIVPAENARILAVETVGGKSHWNFMSALLRSLTDAGHDVTVFTPFPDGDRANYTEVDTSDWIPVKLNMDLDVAVGKFGGPVALMAMFREYGRFYCDAMLGHPRFEEILRARHAAGYDVLLVEPVALDCMSYAATALNVPVVYSIPSPMTSFMERDFTGHSSNPACVSHVMADHDVPDTFARRLTNAAVWAYTVLAIGYTNWYLKTVDPRPYDSSATVHPSVVFVNSFHGTEASRPMPPSVVDVGGVHLKPAESVPEDILEFIEQSPHGVIFFTFGSTIKLSSLPKHIENAFKEALASVPQRVLWKYEEEMTDLPKNVMTRKWFPQRDILMHPNVKLFISHGGMSGVYEALDAGVPVLGFPLFYDQPRNIANLVRAGMAISMDVLTVSKDSLLNAIIELTNNEKYMRNAKIASDRFKDRPMSPQQSVVYWTEYVIRHKGAPHLQYHGQNLSWYQYLLLDVAAALLILVFIFVYITYIVFKFIFSYNLKQLFSRSQNNKVKTN